MVLTRARTMAVVREVRMVAVVGDVINCKLEVLNDE